MALSRSLWRSCRLWTPGPPLPPLPLAAARPRSFGSEAPPPRTSLSRPPWEQRPPPADEPPAAAAAVSAVNRLILQRDFGRLFAVVHFAGRQWKVTDEDLILVQNHIEAGCGERIRLEKVLLLGAQDFTLVGRPLLGLDLVRVEATVVEKTESWPRVHMRFWRRHRFQRKKMVVQPQMVLRINSIELAPRLT